MWLWEAIAQHRQGGCWVLTNHPFLSGRPGRAYALEQLIQGVMELDGIWVTTLAEIAEHTARTVTDIRTHDRVGRHAIWHTFAKLNVALVTFSWAA